MSMNLWVTSRWCGLLLAVLPALTVFGKGILIDFGDLANPVYTGIVSPAHPASASNPGGEGTLTASDTTWNKTLGAGGGLLWSDNTPSGVSLQIGLGFATDNEWGGDGDRDTITWGLDYAHFYTEVNTPVAGIVDTPLMKDCSYWTGAGGDRVGMRLSGLPAGTYRVFPISLVPNGANRLYDFTIGTNVDSYVQADAMRIGPAAADDTTWVAGRQYVAKTITLAEGDSLTLIEIGVGDVPAISGLVVAMVPTGPKPGDTNLDGDVDFGDYQTLEAGFGKPDSTWATGDFNNSGTVDFADYQTLEANFGKSAVPEPTTVGLLLVGGLALIRRR